MTVTLIHVAGRTFSLRATQPEPVFITEQPHTTWARDTPHTGAALLQSWMDPVQGGEALGVCKLPNGREINVRASAIALAANVAARRLGPATRPAPYASKEGTA